MNQIVVCGLAALLAPLAPVARGENAIAGAQSGAVSAVLADAALPAGTKTSGDPKALEAKREKMKKIADAYGCDPAEVQFFRDGDGQKPPVVHTGKNVRLTVAKKKDSALLTFDNEGGEVRVGFDTIGLGFGRVVRTDAVSGKPYSPDVVHINDHDFRMILVRPATEADVPRTAQPSTAHKKREKRIVEKLALKEKEKSYDAIWLGDSITHFWEYCWDDGARTFKEKFPQYRIFNFGFGGDHVEHTIYFIEKLGILDGMKAPIVNLLIGTNNLWQDTPEDTAVGVKACVEAIRRKLPEAKVILISVLPREVAHERNGRDYRKGRPEGIRDHTMEKIARLNKLIRPIADGKNVIWLDLYPQFMGPDGLPRTDLFHDGTHPNAAGYTIMADAMLPIYRQILGK